MPFQTMPRSAGLLLVAFVTAGAFAAECLAQSPSSPSLRSALAFLFGLLAAMTGVAAWILWEERDP